MELSHYVALISLDKERGKKFVEQPEAELAAVGLDTEENLSIVPALQAVVRVIIWPAPPNRDGT